MRHIVLIIFLLSHLCTMAQHRHAVMFYNVENLFDTIKSPTTADEDMHPLADREWNSTKYRHKLTNIANVIAHIADDYPTLVALAEVENRSVLEDLVHTSPIEQVGYAICHYDSPDERGIDVALLYRPEHFLLKGSRTVRAATASPTRDILTAWGEMDGHPTFVAVVHWPSRIGGVRFTEAERRICAKQLRSIVDSVMRHDSATRIVIMGDMNDNPRNHSLRTDLRALARPRIEGDLYNPFAELHSRRRGTSRYDGRWNMYDNIIVSPNTPLLLFDGKHRGAIYRHKDLLSRKGHPLPTYDGTRYTGGVSDHLPIYINIGL